MIPPLPLILSIVLSDSTADSTRTAVLETIAYSADSICFMPSTGDFVLIGSSRVDYRDMNLEADTVRYRSELDLIEASGAPELFDRGESIRGTRMFYDMTARRGMIEGGDSRYEFGFYSGTSITQVGRREFNITDVRFTTCDGDSSDYYFHSPMMKVFQNDRAIARPIYLYVADTPVMYLPYMVFPIRTGRQSGFTIPRFGQTSRDGRFLRGLGYYFAFSDYLDLLVQGDILDRSRFSLSARERHRLRYVHEGRLETEWRREFESHLDRWSLFGSHLHDFPDGTAVRLNAEFLSDRSYLKDTEPEVEDRMKNEVRSWASVSRTFGIASLQLTLDRTAYLDNDPDSIPDETESVQTLPDFRLGINSTPLFSAPSDPSERRFWHSLYWNLSSHYVSMDTRREESRTTHSGLRTASEISASERVLDFLSISPRIGGVFTVYDRDRSGGRYPWWAAGTGSLSLSSDVYGTFQEGGLGYTAFRHTISPRAVIRWSPESHLAGGDDGISLSPADSASTKYWTFSDFSLPSSGGTVQFGLFQSLEAKRESPSGIEKTELASLDLAVSYDMDPGDSERSFSPLSASLNLTPVTLARFRADAAWDLYDRELISMGFTTSLQIVGNDRTLVPDSVSFQGLPYRLSFTHHYTRGFDGADDLSKIRASASLELTPSWSIDYTTYYDISKGSFINQSYTLRRDLHCWEALFVRHISDMDSGFYFRINIVDLPDIKVEQHVSNF